MIADPTLDFEVELHDAGHRYVIGCDEVGRGAIAGPVAVGVTMVDAGVGAFPVGLRDSKMLSEKNRDRLAPLAAEWVLWSAVGLSSAREVDKFGIMAALGLAGRRALSALHASGGSIRESMIVLDGSFDWLSPTLTYPLRLTTRVKADRDCASVAAASVIAKQYRDALMIDADARTPGYGWAGNKGYGSAGHFDAISRLGATELHRHSWLKLRPTTPGLGLPQHG